MTRLKTQGRPRALPTRRGGRFPLSAQSDANVAVASVFVLTNVERSVLRVLLASNKLVNQEHVGNEVWNHPSVRFARAAGKVLKALNKLGLAEYVVEENDVYGWRITQIGATKVSAL